MEIWVLKDARTGTFNQALGVAEAIKELYGHDFTVKEFNLTRLAKLPNWLLNIFPKLGLSMTKSTREGLMQGNPDILIAAGRRQCPAARFIQKKHSTPPLTALIMDPNGCYGKFELIAIPKHDSFKRAGKNILRITGAPNRVRDNRLKAEAEKWAKKFAGLPRPWVGLIIGGAAKWASFDPKEVPQMMEKTIPLTDGKGSMLLTTSSATPPQVTAEIQKRLPENNYQFIWGQTQGDNPYLAFMALCDKIVVTGDSISMCSESCGSMAKEVYIYAVPGLRTPKYDRFNQSLFDDGYARPLGEGFGGVERPRLSISDQLAKIIMELKNAKNI